METAAVLSLLDALAHGIDAPVPVEALRQAVAHWDHVGPALLAALETYADGSDRTERTADILLYGVYLMAQAREPRAFPLLCAIAADGDLMWQLLGDAGLDDLSVILARTYDGDASPLCRVIEDPAADELVRSGGIEALTVLTYGGRIDRARTAAYLRRLHDVLRPRDPHSVWVAWQQALAMLCLDDLVPLAEDAFRRGWVPRDVITAKQFRDDLRAAKASEDPASLFDGRVRDDGRLDDIALYFSQPPGETEPTEDAVIEPVRNPYRNVGRNDPCPCGSGKKFKKCCLGTL
jgi:hypothetical protein